MRTDEESLRGGGRSGGRREGGRGRGGREQLVWGLEGQDGRELVGLKGEGRALTDGRAHLDQRKPPAGPPSGRGGQRGGFYNKTEVIK